MKENFSDRLKGLQGELSGRAFADKCGIDDSTMRGYLGGKHEPTIAGLKKIAAACSVRVGWLATGEGQKTSGETGEGNTSLPPAGARRVPVISWVQAGEWTEIVDVYQPGEDAEWVAVSGKAGQHAFGLRISGTSMEPLFLEGDIIIVDPAVEAESGKLVVARLNHDNEATFKKLVRDGGRTYLEPLNKRYQPIDITDRDVTICGVVRQVVREV